MSARAARSRSAVGFCRAQALGSAEPTLVPEQWYAPASAHLVAPVARDDGKRARCAYRAQRPRDAVERVELALTEAARVAEAAQQVPRRHCAAAGRRRPSVGLLRARSGAQAAAVRACAQFHAPRSRNGRACVCASACPHAYAQAASTCAKCGSGTAAKRHSAPAGGPALRGRALRGSRWRPSCTIASRCRSRSRRSARVERPAGLRATRRAPWMRALPSSSPTARASRTPARRSSCSSARCTQSL